MALTNAQLVLSATQTAGDTLAGLHGWYQAHVATFGADVTLQRRIPKIGSTDATDWRDTAVIIEGTDFSAPAAAVAPLSSARLTMRSSDSKSATVWYRSATAFAKARSTTRSSSNGTPVLDPVSGAG